MNPAHTVSKMTAVAAVLMTAFAAFPTKVAADESDAIAYRQHIMKAMDAQTAALGMILSGAIPPENLVSHLDAIAQMAATGLDSFKPKVPGGESSPDVWAKWADFETRMNAFAANTAKVAKIARDQGQDAVMSELATALSCKSCHDLYRAKR